MEKLEIYLILLGIPFAAWLFLALLPGGRPAVIGHTVVGACALGLFLLAYHSGSSWDRMFAPLPILGFGTVMLATAPAQIWRSRQGMLGKPAHYLLVLLITTVLAVASLFLWV